ncbi:unnamed protein product [Tilletia controversa]|uniref:Uncharacterized protein n=3 Tax=Tilletia TaxID=13289 RepID=A0A8X7STJ9_9BASI|nr:hypothetical protein CF335_g7546 [Tilletia laevis]KAE8240144.1 hypothetical protein A4X06_0g7890 [Tilletia controversa]KAE8246845.1 hypothetical protein A4X03_0g7203 [Tilletia caries]CAD6889239.1 unnamed protein product [Tilletia caries]CAD6915731.1 unnamed protein product [Tilletia controversa]
MMTVLNLPPRLRHLQALTYLVGCTPGPKEPSATKVGGYLQPLLDELKEFSNGKTIRTHAAPTGRMVRLRVLFYVGDSVERNKICGFPSHSVRKGQFCGFCEVEFSSKTTAFEAPATSRDPEGHRQDSIRFDRPFSNKASREEHERTTGARPSALTSLPYWKSVLRAPVDSMHSLELGLVKRLFHRTLILGKTVTPAHLLAIQAALKSSSVPQSEQAPDHRLGDPGGVSATAAHWSTLGRRLLVLVLFVAWKKEIGENSDLKFEVPTKETTEPNSSTSTRARSRAPTSAAGQQDNGPPPPPPRSVMRDKSSITWHICLRQPP